MTTQVVNVGESDHSEESEKIAEAKQAPKSNIYSSIWGSFLTTLPLFIYGLY